MDGRAKSLMDRKVVGVSGYLSICLCVCLFICLSVYLSMYLFFLSIYFTVCLSAYLSIYLSLSLYYWYIHTYIHIYLFACVNSYAYMCMWAFTYIYLHVYRSIDRKIGAAQIRQILWQPTHFCQNPRDGMRLFVDLRILCVYIYICMYAMYFATIAIIIFILLLVHNITTICFVINWNNVHMIPILYLGIESV